MVIPLGFVVTVVVEDSFRKVNVILLVILRFLVSVGMYIRSRSRTPRNRVFFEELMISQLAKKFLISVEPEGPNYRVHKRPSLDKVNPDLTFTP
jgi:hypothetical protein